MKTRNMKSVLAMGLVCLTQAALAQTAPALPTVAASDYQKDAQKWLTQKTAQVKTLESGVQIRPVSKEYIDKAINRLGGKGTVDFGNEQKVKLQSEKSSSGVHVGSGSNSLLATSSADQAGQVVVQAPILPSTSITVVGRWGDEQSKMQICAVGYLTDKQGQIRLKEGLNYFYSMNRCTKLNAALRVGPGYYKIYLKDPILSGLSGASGPNLVSMVVHVDQGENKVIPLREIAVPKAPVGTNSEVYFTVSSDITAKTELQKRMLDLFYRSSNSNIGNYILNFSSTDILKEDFLKIRNPNSFVDLCLQPEIFKESFLCKFTSIERGSAEAINYTSLVAWNKAGNFISVFPGTYNIQWQIDGQADITSGIVVE